MKKFLIIFASVVMIFSACRKDDAPVFDKTPDERLNETLTKYQTQLSGAQYGWKATVYPAAGGIYTFYFKFNNANRVQMLSSFDSSSAVTIRESSYRLKALQQPSLIFDTYSYLHVLSDPNPTVNGQFSNEGFLSDFEYYFDSSSNDTIKLIGRFHGSKAILVKATQAEATAFANGQLANGLLLNKLLTYYKRITIGSLSIDFNFDPITRAIRLPDNQGNLLDSTKISPYYLSLGGITFATPLKVGNQSISSLNNLTYSASTQTLTCTVDNNVTANITEVAVPQKVDAGAPARWWNYAVNNQGYYGSRNGFHVNGVEDGYKLNSIPGYQFLYFEPKAVPYQGNIMLDFLGPVINDSLNYGAVFQPPFFTASGVVVFQYLGRLGTVPSSQLAAYNSTTTKMSDGSGYYLIQTSGLKYDMVSARDGKAWVSWISLK